MVWKSPGEVPVDTANGPVAAGPPRNRAMGVYAALSIAGGAVGLIAGGLLTTYLSWRWVFFVNVPIGIVAALMAPRAIGETPRRRGRFDVPGAITATFGLAALVYGLSSAAVAAAPRPGILLATGGSPRRGREDADHVGGPAEFLVQPSCESTLATVWHRRVRRAVRRPSGQAAADREPGRSPCSLWFALRRRRPTVSQRADETPGRSTTYVVDLGQESQTK